MGRYAEYDYDDELDPEESGEYEEETEDSEYEEEEDEIHELEVDERGYPIRPYIPDYEEE